MIVEEKDFEKLKKSINKRIDLHQRTTVDQINKIENNLDKKYSVRVDSIYRKIDAVETYQSEVARLTSDIKQLHLGLHDIYKECLRLKNELAIKDKKLIDYALQNPPLKIEGYDHD